MLRTAPSAVQPSCGHTPRCRICYDSSDGQPELGRLIRPCNCSGSVALVHEGCLNRWMEGRGSMRCELCHTDYEILNCGLKKLTAMSLPRPLDDDFESRFEFAFLALWIIDTAQLVGHALCQGPQGFQLHFVSRFGEGWFFYVGCFCTCVNLFYYGAVLTLVADQWLWENSVFVLKDRNSRNEREEIVAKLRLGCGLRTSPSEFATCKERQLKTN